MIYILRTLYQLINMPSHKKHIQYVEAVEMNRFLLSHAKKELFNVNEQVTLTTLSYFLCEDDIQII